jgi:hypothetical protein
MVHFTMVISCTMVVPWYKCTTCKTMVHFAMVSPWLIVPRFLRWYIGTMAISYAMILPGCTCTIQKHGTSHHGVTLVKGRILFRVVKLYHGYQWYHGITRVQLYHPKNLATIYHDRTMGIPC